MFIPVFVMLMSFAGLGAEYRAYLLDIKVDRGIMKNGEKIIEHKLLMSSLDHVQYPAWYGLKPEQVDTLDSWMCFGDTSGFAKPCSKSEPLPASTAGAEQ